MASAASVRQLAEQMTRIENLLLNLTGDNPSPQKVSYTDPPRTPKLALSKLTSPTGAGAGSAGRGGLEAGAAGVLPPAKSRGPLQTLQNLARGASPLSSPRLLRSFSLGGGGGGGGGAGRGGVAKGGREIWREGGKEGGRESSSSRPGSVEISSDLTPRRMEYDADGVQVSVPEGGMPEGTAPSATSSLRDAAPPPYNVLRDSFGSPEAASAGSGAVGLSGEEGGSGERQSTRETRLTAKIQFADEIQVKCCVVVSVRVWCVVD